MTCNHVSYPCTTCGAGCTNIRIGDEPKPVVTAVKVLPVHRPDFVGASNEELVQRIVKLEEQVAKLIDAFNWHHHTITEYSSDPSDPFRHEKETSGSSHRVKL